MRFSTIAMAAGFALLVAGGAAYADVTIVSNVWTEYPSPKAEEAGAPSHHIVTTYYQGDNVRVESDGGDVRLYDLKARTVYRLTPSNKTYTVVPVGQLPPDDSRSDLAEKIQARSKTDIQIRPKDDADAKPGDAKTLAVTATTETQAAGGRGGNGGGGRTGRFPRTGSQRNPSPTGIIQGEYRLSSNVRGLSYPPQGRIALLPFYAETLPENHTTVKFLEDFTERMNRQASGFPVYSRVEVKQRSRSQTGGDAASMVVTMELKSVREGPIDRSIFFVPTDYKQTYPVPVEIKSDKGSPTPSATPTIQMPPAQAPPPQD